MDTQRLRELVMQFEQVGVGGLFTAEQQRELCALAQEAAQHIATLEAHLVLVSRELTSTDNADRYFRGFNDGYDHAKTQQGE